jgi:hypothetical protein
MEGKKELFTFRTRVVSSVYHRDENYTTFLRERVLPPPPRFCCVLLCSLFCDLFWFCSAIETRWRSAACRIR